MKETAVYTCPPHITWVKDSQQTIIIDGRQRRNHILRGPEAAIWSWLTLAYSYPRLCQLLAALLDQSPAQAEQQLQTTLETWHQAGLLQWVEA